MSFLAYLQEKALLTAYFLSGTILEKKSKKFNLKSEF